MDTIDGDRLARRGDGRNIAPEAGLLLGEGAQMDVRAPDAAYPARRGFDRVPSEAYAEAPGTYYDQPTIKEPVWIWTIPAYFYVGGMSGAMSALAAMVRLGGGGRFPALARHARWVATTGEMLSGVLLIADLGRPARFLNMLRVFRPTSPMSVGSWILAASGASSTLGLLADRRGWLGHFGQAGELVAGLLGMPLAGYTGVLLANTAVPVWQRAHRALPALFIGSGLASAASLCELMPLGGRERRLVRRLAVSSKALELVLAEVLELEVGRARRAARPLRAGASGLLWNASKVLGLLGLGLSVASGRRPRARTLAGALTTAAAVALRAAVFKAGRSSAKDPRATLGSPGSAGSAREEGRGMGRGMGRDVAVVLG